LAGLEEVFGLVLEMAEVGVFGELARGFFGVAGHGDLLSVAPGVRTTGRKKVCLASLHAGGLLPFPRTGCVLYAEVNGTGVKEGRQAEGVLSELLRGNEHTAVVDPRAV
jgi:hypothetical protein